MKVLLTNNRGGVLIKTVHQDDEVFTIPGQGLYAWVTESQFKLMKFDGKDPIKFGQYGANAKEGSKTPQSTIQSYKWLTESAVILWAHKLTDQELVFGNAYQIEQRMRNHIGPRCPDGDSTEVFYTSIDRIKTSFSDIVYNTRKKDVYPPRIRQQEAIDKMVNFFLNGGNDFLLNAIMRFGKNFTFLTTAKHLVSEGGNILILTNKPGVFDSLEKDIKSHVYFDNWEYFKLRDVKDIANLKLSKNKVSVIAISKQLTDNKVSGKKVRSFIKKTNFDIALFDECHSGTNTETFAELEKSLNVKYKVFASGTPFKTIVSRAYTDSNTYSYGYIEQQKDKRAGICSDAVTLQSYIPAIDQEFISNPNFIEEESFTLKKLLAVDEYGEFIFGGEVRQFLEDVLGISVKKKNYSPYRLCSGELNHTVWLLQDSVKVAEAVGKMIESITDEYKVLVASGNNIVDIQEVHDAIEMNEKTITLTIERFKEGTTVPKWTGAFVMSDTKSVEKYFQFIFRVASPNIDKDKAYVFDFSPERAFQMCFEFANAQAINTNSTDSQAMLKEWLDNYNVYRSGNGPQLVKVQVEDVLEIIANGDYRAATLKTSSNKYLDIQNLMSIYSSFSKLNVKNNTDKIVEAYTNNLGEGKNYVTIRNSSEKISEVTDKKDLEQAQKNIANIIASLPLLGYRYKCKTVEEIYLKSKDSVFKEFSGVNKSLFGILLPALDTRFINLYL
jgi:hypothetical protein